MTISFGALRKAPVEYRHRSRGGSVTTFAQAVHARLFGLPADDEPLPTALDALLQATHTATSPEQKTAVLQRLADRLGNAAEIIRDYQHDVRSDRLPDDIAEQLRHAHDQIQQVAQTLGLVAPALTTRPAARTAPGPSHTPAPAPVPPAGRAARSR
ncbi:hypothetical protein JG491_33075 [Streptomyces sp. CRPSP2-6A1]|uniref:hypothetical protein n=1 Tax=Streptomyces TaxID=1883 RepID=UPI0018F0D266|nr:hypothetical protein [Streptomyces sp. CRPSP2-6A1]MBJ7004842.1 hypothetical protein [Streptomyces sp. CRPSP2-6A1]